MDRKDIIVQIRESIAVKNRILAHKETIKQIMRAADILTECYRNDGILLTCGNGGSASDAEHMAGELVGRFLMERRALPAIAFGSNSAVVTAIGNDNTFHDIYVRQLEAFANPKNVLLAITTSGNSGNVVEALKKAKDSKMKTIALLGRDGGEAKVLADVPIIVPSEETPRIQESHILIIHILCDLAERNLCEGY
nr:SIS domain-containing protein [uncultured Schaedlerella sp.]